MPEAIETIEDVVRVHAGLRPDAPICMYNERLLTFADMDRRSNQVANALLRAGIHKESRVALFDKNSNALFETLFGARKIGAVQVAVNWRLAPAEVAYILNDCEAELVFMGAEFLPTLHAVVPELRRKPKIIALSGEGGDANYESWLAEADTIDAGLSSASDDVALQLYTSGTTGRPKGAMLTNRSIFAFVRSAGEIFGVDPQARHLNCLPLFHVGGINWALQAMAQGAQCIGFREFDPATIIQAIESCHATHLMTVPAVLQLLLNANNSRTSDYSTLRAIVYGGSTISERVLRDALNTFKCGFYGMYGSTELSFGNTLLPPEEHNFDLYPELITSCGRPFPGSRIKIIDPASLAELPEGETGEVWVHSPQRAKGYWNQPTATAEAFREDGWYRTGDIGTLRSGHLHLSDRLNDMVVSGGENIYPAEVERSLLEHPDVAEAAVIGIPDAKWGEAVAAFVVMQPGAAFQEQPLIEFTRARLARYKCPSLIRACTELPRTASGKVQRHVLRRPFWEGRDRKIN